MDVRQWASLKPAKLKQEAFAKQELLIVIPGRSENDAISSCSGESHVQHRQNSEPATHNRKRPSLSELCSSLACKDLMEICPLICVSANHSKINHGLACSVLAITVTTAAKELKDIWACSQVPVAFSHTVIEQLKQKCPGGPQCILELVIVSLQLLMSCLSNIQIIPRTVQVDCPAGM
ncbi:hypothetical protein JD844_007889 [Phrynosoma platyrhinos]|uniref:Uncharacterized protein n=1 Tax=Phrynosoma platyrhinos TaxID=52577 RepID=A0ABQ7T3W0_PHRPL|nr:hypothetical protein JD844_007889 [Phrynosoma platyrhinos]